MPNKLGSMISLFRAVRLTDGLHEGQHAVHRRKIDRAALIWTSPRQIGRR